MAFQKKIAAEDSQVLSETASKIALVFKALGENEVPELAFWKEAQIQGFGVRASMLNDYCETRNGRIRLKPLGVPNV